MALSCRSVECAAEYRVHLDGQLRAGVVWLLWERRRTDAEHQRIGPQRRALRTLLYAAGLWAESHGLADGAILVAVGLSVASRRRSLQRRWARSAARDLLRPAVSLGRLRHGPRRQVADQSSVRRAGRAEATRLRRASCLARQRRPRPDDGRRLAKVREGHSGR